jgi:hypothetical protein
VPQNHGQHNGHPPHGEYDDTALAIEHNPNPAKRQPNIHMQNEISIAHHDVGTNNRRIWFKESSGQWINK